MKTGAVAKRFGVDPNTITDWTKRFKEFFTPEALADDKTQRDYQPEDVIVLNTIRAERARNANWEQIRAKLRAGDRDANLPPEFTTIDGESAITVYTELRELRSQLATANQEIERLREEGRSKDADIRALEREVGKWQAKYEMLQERLEAEDAE